MEKGSCSPMEAPLHSPEQNGSSISNIMAAAGPLRNGRSVPNVMEAASKWSLHFVVAMGAP